MYDIIFSLWNFPNFKYAISCNKLSEAFTANINLQYVNLNDLFLFTRDYLYIIMIFNAYLYS